MTTGPSDMQARALAQLGRLGRSTSEALQRGLTFRENFRCAVRTLTVAVPDVAWIAPTLVNTWANYGTGFPEAGYRIDSTGLVRVKGLLKDGDATSGTILFTLPVGYRPAERIQFGGVSATTPGTTWADCRIDAHTGGEVTIVNGGNVFLSLAQVQFYAKGPAAPPAAFSGGGWPLQLDTGLGAAPWGLDVWRVEDVTPTASLTATTSSTYGDARLQWRPLDAGRILITSCTGLSPGRSYRLTVFAHAG